MIYFLLGTMFSAVAIALFLFWTNTDIKDIERLVEDYVSKVKLGL
jgi:hypothetical protein